MEPIWIDRYLAERIGPLDEQWLPLVQREAPQAHAACDRAPPRRGTAVGGP